MINLKIKSFLKSTRSTNDDDVQITTAELQLLTGLTGLRRSAELFFQQLLAADVGKERKTTLRKL